MLSMRLFLLITALCGAYAFYSVSPRRERSLLRVNMRSSGGFFPFKEMRADSSLCAKNVDDTLSESKSPLTLHFISLMGYVPWPVALFTLTNVFLIGLPHRPSLLLLFLLQVTAVHDNCWA